MRQKGMNLLFVLFVVAPLQEPDARAEFERLLPTASFAHLKEVPDLIFAGDEESFLRGVKILEGLRHGGGDRNQLVDLNLIPWRLAREKGWARGREAAEWFILAYAGTVDQNQGDRIRKAIGDTVKDSKDPADLKTLDLITMVGGKAERPVLLTFAKDNRPQVRGWALHRIADLNNPADTPLIAGFLKDADPANRPTAIRILGFRNSVEHADAIAGFLDDPSYATRRVTIEAIGRLKAHQFAKRIVPFLADKTDRGGDARSWAANALRNLESAEAVDDVLALFSHEEASVRRSAIALTGHWKLKRTVPRVVAMLGDKDAGVREEAVDALAALGAGDMSGLIAERLDDAAEMVRARAAIALGDLGAKKQADRIAELGRDGKVPRGAAAYALIRFEAKDRTEAIADLVEAMAREFKPTGRHGPEAQPRIPRHWELVALACKKGMNDCVLSLMKRGGDVPALRSAVLNSLPESGNTALLKMLNEAGYLDSKEAQAGALRAYENAFTAEAIPNLMALVRKLDPEVERHLSSVERKLAEFPDLVAPYTEDGDAKVRRLAGVALCQARDPKHLPRVVKLMEDPDKGIRAAVTQQAAFMPSTEQHEAVARRLRDSDPWVRCAAVSGIWWMRLNRYVPEVVALLSDAEPQVVSQVLYALEFLDVRKESARIVPLLAQPKWAARAAELLRSSGNPDCIDPLLKLAKEGDAEARGAAIRAVAVLGGKDKLPDLDALLADKEEFVRAAAVFAVGRFKETGRKAELAGFLKDPRHLVKAEAATALAEIDARDHAEGIAALLELPEDQHIPVAFGGAKSARYLAGEAASAALLKLNAVDTAPRLAEFLKRSKDPFTMQRLGLLLVRMDAKRFMPEILGAHVGGWPTGVLFELNRVTAPRLFERLESAAFTDPRLLIRGPLKTRAERFSEVFGVRITIEASVPEAALQRREPLWGPGRSALQAFTNIVPIECGAIFDDEAGEIRIVSSEIAKAHWLDWAKAK